MSPITRSATSSFAINGWQSAKTAIHIFSSFTDNKETKIPWLEAQFNEGPKNTMRGRVHKNGGLLNLTKTCQSQMSILDIVYCN